MLKVAIFNGIPADDIAATQVVAQTRTLVLRMPKENGIPAMGVLMSPYPNFVGDVAEVCVDLEDHGLVLSIARVNGKPYLAAMRQRTHCPAPRTQK